MKKNIIGIDFGASSLVVSRINELDQPEVFTFSSGDQFLPACVFFLEDEFFVGKEAKKRASLAPKNFVSQIKSKFYKNKYLHVASDEEKHPAFVYAAELLKFVKSDFEKLHGPITSVVLTYPVMFSNEEKEALLKAAKLADLPVVGIVSEERAISLYYASKFPHLHGKYIIFGVGGEYSFAAISEITRQSKYDFDADVYYCYGLDFEGGKDFDNTIFEHMKEAYYSEKFAPLYTSNSEKLDYLDIAKEIKEALTYNTSYTKQISGTKGDFTFTLTQKEFNKLIAYNVSEIMGLMNLVSKDDDNDIEEAKGVLLSGGSMRIPYLQSYFQKTFDIEILMSEEIESIVALGAAIACFLGTKHK